MPAILVVAFGVLWIASGDPIRAATVLVIVVLLGAFLVLILKDLVSEAVLWYRRLSGVPWEEHLKRLEAKGKAIREEYEAHSALTVEDHTTGRLMHFVDIGSGRILCLYGQSYYEFEPIDDDPEENQARQFPTRTFSVVRHAKKNEVLALIPGSDVLEPTICDPIVKPKKLLKLGFQLTDGEIVSELNLRDVERVLKAAT